MDGHVSSYNEFVDWLEDVDIEKDGIKIRMKLNRAIKNEKDCLKMNETYQGMLIIYICEEDGKKYEICGGNIPIMVGSKRSSLSGEEGYFIINGNEKMIRFLQMLKTNYALNIQRNSYLKKGQNFTNYAISMRASKKNFLHKTFVLHLLTSEKIVVKCLIQKREIFFPLFEILCILRPDLTWKKIFESIIGKQQFSSGSCKEKILQQAEKVIGEIYRDSLGAPTIKKSFVHEFLKNYIAIQTADYTEKFDILIFMAKKLLSAAKKKCAIENIDAFAFHDLFLPGHLFIGFLYEQILHGIDLLNQRRDQNSSSAANKIFAGIGLKFHQLLATGNLVSRTNLDLQQSTGFAIIADRLNYLRFQSHFRAVHRGQFFTTMKTTTVRKLLPESWGFLCPVHTPDGAPCGLLSHLTKDAFFTSTQNCASSFVNILFSLGMQKLQQSKHDLYIFLDGIVVGFITDGTCALHLVRGIKNAFPLIETVYFGITTEDKQKKINTPYPGIFLFTLSGRLVRPINKNTENKKNKVVYIGPLEQLSLTLPIEHVPLSMIASLTPFSYLNQSPRNIYQCQMAKQTMGTPVYEYTSRSDKLYRLITPQSPLVTTTAYQKYNFDLFAQGTNAIIAVIAYTGYDMEDAMIIKKSTHERGFGRACIYKTKFIHLETETQTKNMIFQFLPSVGHRIKKNDIFWIATNPTTKKEIKYLYDQAESCYIDSIRIFSSSDSRGINKVAITLRYDRPSKIGDKYASRHGQKGVLSYLMPEIDMPFSESGISPDIIINPHAFPSRMTIGMLLEILFAKSIAMQYPPAQFQIQDIGRALVSLGYAYNGSEPIYSGISGNLLHMDIFLGPCYYQRLRHMVSDKLQVRSEGPVHELTRQPVKGRKRHGGIRLGEMERDALLAHGTSFIINDRLFFCSDLYSTLHCANPHCSSHSNGAAFFFPHADLHNEEIKKFKYTKFPHLLQCRWCHQHDLQPIAFPYILRFLLAELAAMNCKIRILPSSSKEEK